MIDSTQLAPNGKRFLAYLIDILIMVVGVFGVAYFFFGFDKIVSSYMQRGADSAPREVFLYQRTAMRDIAFLIWLLYCAIAESSPKQGTIGKQLMGIKVVNTFGYPLTLKQSISRNFAKIISYKVIGLGFFWIFVDKNQQGWHDKLAKTYVVKADFIRE
jgi:uncharacterized RDD family membrane protein YckC